MLWKFQLNPLNGSGVVAIMNLSTIAAVVLEQFGKNQINGAQLGIISYILRKSQLNSLNGWGVVAMIDLVTDM